MLFTWSEMVGRFKKALNAAGTGHIPTSIEVNTSLLHCLNLVLIPNSQMKL